MKHVLLLTLIVALAATNAIAQYPEVNVRDIQFVPTDSLAVADTITGFSSNSTQARWTLQVSSHMKKYVAPSPTGSAFGDTVVLTGICVVPPKVLNWNVGGWTMLLYDTSSTETWGGVLVMASTSSDTTKLLLDGFMNVAAGDILTMTGVVAEFPTARGYSGTEFFPIPGKPIQIVGSHALPKAKPLSVSQFFTGLYPAGKVNYATGEQYEGQLVEFTNVTVAAKVNTSRGTFSFIDASGNQLTMYDASKYFTRGTATRPADTTWVRLYENMSTGVRIDTIRGLITSVSGGEGPRGYWIAPVYPGDVKFSPFPAPPVVASHRRNPVVVTPDSSARVSARVIRQTNGSTAKTVQLYYSVNNGAFTPVTMSPLAGDTLEAAIPQQAANSVVRYFVAVVDSFNQTVRLANSSTDAAIAADTTKGFFLYTSLARGLTIQDVQYTPYVNGRSPYLGAVVTLSGVVTADTSRIGLSSVSNGSTNAWYMQSTSTPWSGIWLNTSDTTAQKAMAALRNGDSIAVTGTVQEQFDVTRLGNITSVAKISSGNPEPVPVAKTTGTFNVSNGAPGAEQYEGMLVRFNNVTVTNINSTFSDLTEYSVNDGSGAVVVQHSGKYSYSNMVADTLLGKTILKVGDRIGSLTGIVYYSFNQYKFVPRTDADFLNVVLTGVNDQVASLIPDAYVLNQNYPNPFNPSTTIRFALPTAGQTTLKVYNLLGQEMATLVNGVMPAGVHTASFNASSLSSGVYFFRIESGSFRAVKKMMLVK